MVGGTRRGASSHAPALDAPTQDDSAEDTVSLEEWCRGLSVQEYHEWWAQIDKEAEAKQVEGPEAEPAADGAQPPLKKLRVFGVGEDKAPLEEAAST